MEVKGVTVKAVESFVKNRYPDRYDEWLENLPEPSKEVYANPIFTAGWYSVEDALVQPTKIMGKLFYGGNTKKVALESGAYVAETAIKGIHKAFIKLGSPGFLVSMSSKAFNSYFRPAKIELGVKEKNKASVLMRDFDPPSDVMEYRILGYMQRALELSGAKNVKVTIGGSLTKGDAATEFLAHWD